MKKFAIAALVAAAATVPAVALAYEPAKKETPAAATTAPAAAATAPAAGAPKPALLKDGKTWVKIEGEKALVSTDGKEWAPAPDGIHEFKDGTKAETKGGLLIKK